MGGPSLDEWLDELHGPLPVKRKGEKKESDVEAGEGEDKAVGEV